MAGFVQGKGNPRSTFKEPSRQPLVTVIGNGTKENPWDWIHINSIQLLNIDGADYYLVDARHTYSVFLVDPNDGGRLVWKLDGETGGDFGPVPEDGSLQSPSSQYDSH